MSAQSGAGMRLFLARRPALLAWALQVQSRIQNARAALRPIHLAALIAIVIALMGVLPVAAKLEITRSSLAWLAQHPFSIGLASALFEVLAMPRRRADLASEFERGWLASTPLPRRAWRQLAAIRLSARFIALWFSIALLILILCELAGTPHVGMLWVALTSGALVGGAVGSVWPAARSADRREDSRYVAKARSRGLRPSLAGLSHWPIARALAWHRPENSRWLFVAAALSVPMGSSALLGLAILVVWSLGSYLWLLVRSLRRVARDAALWLRPTGISFPQFAWALARRALMHQCIGTAIFITVLVVMGATFNDAVYAGATWLSIVCMLAAIDSRHGFLARPSAVRAAASVAAVLGFEFVTRGLGIGLSAAIAIAHCREVTHVRS